MFKLPFGGGDSESDGVDLFEDFGPQMSMIPSSPSDLKVSLDPSRPLGMSLTKAAWVDKVEPPEGQAAKAGICKGMRVIRCESHSAWSSCCGLDEVKLALEDVRGRGDPDIKIVLSGALPGELKWNGGCLGPDNFIYCIPANALEVLRIEVSTGCLSTFGHLPALDPIVGDVDDRWFGGVAARNGKVYGVPFNSTQLLEIDPQKLTCFPVGPALLHGKHKWRGAVVCQFGRVHCVPCDAPSVLCFDPKTHTAFTFGDLSAEGANKWHGGVFCTHDERIWCVPFDADKVLVVDSELRSITFMFDPASGQSPLPETGRGKWSGAVVGPDECIYCIPYNATCVLKLDPQKRTASALGNFPRGFGKWAGGVLAPDGCIYGIPHHATHLLRIDPALEEAVQVGRPLPPAKGRPCQWRGGCLGGDGDVYAVPADAPAVLRLHTAAFAQGLEEDAKEAKREAAAAAAAEAESKAGKSSRPQTSSLS